ncbi:helix-turn-helix domain-containing protein [Pseudomonas fontis]|uniref:XRE family transcriptional regulator n=1 Tax=Pseudomonas fontis TaxID=2942633 RepID=A0ABT5NM59_9PSED|nr:XRE family transcriptional regulator [Pseudomonas fontis]MDD0976114.1 XRE family transcriptional regulator [Pseudomonas fontis]MDD0989022.1 XRE family transcriptional regulator [Pseudomonas fontis]
MHKDSSQRASVLQHVSQNIRRLRHAAQLSQTALAEKSGVSRRMLVAIEAGEKNVSLTTLDLIAEALDVAFSDLIQAPDNRDPSRINELAWTGVHPGSRAVLLASSQATREVELWEWRLEPGEVYSADADAAGWSEQIYVFEGSMTLLIEDREYRLAAGDFHSFASDRAHAYRNEGEVVVRFVRNVVI